MTTQVYNITDNLPGHNHPGDPTYIAYSHGCRHHDCLNEFNLYKLRLAARKIDGGYRDLRWRENQLLAAATQAGDQYRTAASEAPETATYPTTPAIAPPAVSVESGAAETLPSEAAPEPAEEDSGDLDQVRKYLEVFCSIPGTKGKLNAAMLGVMPRCAEDGAGSLPSRSRRAGEVGPAGGGWHRPVSGARLTCQHAGTTPCPTIRSSITASWSRLILPTPSARPVP